MAAVLYLVTNPVTGKSLPVATQPEKRLQYIRTQVNSVGSSRQQDAGFFFLQASTNEVDFFKWEELKRDDLAPTGQVFGHEVQKMIKTGNYYKPTEAFKQLCLMAKEVGIKGDRTNPGTHGTNNGTQREASQAEVEAMIGQRREEIRLAIVSKMIGFGWKLSRTGNLRIDTPVVGGVSYRLVVVEGKRGGFRVDIVDLSVADKFISFTVNDRAVWFKTQEEAKEVGLEFIAMSLVDGLL